MNDDESAMGICLIKSNPQNTSYKSYNQKEMKELKINGTAITDNAIVAHEFHPYFIQSVEEVTQKFHSPTVTNHAVATESPRGQ